MKRAFPPLFLLALMAGCTQFPALDARLTPEVLAADYPDLVPLGPILAETVMAETVMAGTIPAGTVPNANSGAAGPEQTVAALDARIAALQSRAAALRGSVLSGPERQRLDDTPR